MTRFFLRPLLGMLLVLPGCGTVHFDVPEGSRVKLLEVDAPASVRVERFVWYALWGGVELSDNHTASMIGEAGLVEVRIQCTYTFWDTVLNTFTSLLSFSGRRVIVEGNPGPGRKP